MARRFGPSVYFTHLRATRRETPDPRFFHEAAHLDDQHRNNPPGYPLYGRLKGLA